MKFAYIKSPVVVGQMNDRSVEILSGILVADEVVVRGAYSLAFAGGGSISLKEALDAAHGHEHNVDGSEMTAAQKAAKAAAAGGGHAHADEEAGGDFLWKIISGVLAVALVLTALRGRKRAEDPRAKPNPQSKPETV